MSKLPMRAKDIFLKLLREPFWLIFAAVLGWDVLTVTSLCFTPDWANTWGWARNIQADGLCQIYAGQPLYNYPPLMAYMLWLFDQGFASEAALRESLYFTKLFPLAFDFIAAVVAVKWAGQKRGEAIFLLVLIGNPLYIFNSYTWGQIDSTYCALVFFSLYAALRDRPVCALLLYVLAFNFKVQALLFAPLFALVLLWKFRNPWPARRIALAFAAAIVLQLAILAPFILAGEFGHLYEILKHPVNYYRSISMNAFNFWHFFYGAAAFHTDDTVNFIVGFTAQQVGLALFFSMSFMLLAPPLLRVARAKITGFSLGWNEENLLLMFGIIPLIFFFFCTQMHERYSQSAILFLAVYSFRTRRYWLLGLMFLAYGLNVEYVFQYHQLQNGWRLLFDSRFVAALYATLIGSLLWLYFHSLPKPITAPAIAPPAGVP